MDMKMEVTCGTRRLTKFEVDLDDCGFRRDRSHVDDRDIEAAFDLLRETMDDLLFADDGCRNKCAVNGCIALHVLGYNPARWFRNFFDIYNADMKFFNSDKGKFMEHVHRVCGDDSYSTNYLLRWGPEGDEGKALGYSID